MGILGDVLFVMRVGSNPDFSREVERVFTPANTQPTSGDSGRGTAFGQTGPTTLEETRRISIIADRNQTTLPFAGL